MRESKEVERFRQLLSKTISVPRAEVERRIKEEKPEKMNRHKRFSYDPSEASSSSSS